MVRGPVDELAKAKDLLQDVGYEVQMWLACSEQQEPCPVVL